jgi:septal ring factor EnvC (AmiA/AmiB activator)
MTAISVEQAEAADVAVATATPETDEAKLKSEIKALEKKITNKQDHITRLSAELKAMKDDLLSLKRQRVALLSREIEPEPEAQ